MSSSGGTDSSKPGSGKGGFVPPSTADLDAILDQYEFLELLGRGGMGAVYKARQKSLDRLVAIKILPPHLTHDADEQGFHFAERFQREAKAMARLSHPHIVGVFDFGQARDGQFYFVMEYVEGTDLHALIRTGELTPEHVSGWMSQICAALQYAHDKGIVHRDIKPANIMITRDSQVKVADFGLAKLAGSDAAEQTKLTMTNMAMGTPDYVAPEALEIGVEVDHRADLYALGVMLYEMLTGKVPRGNWKSPSLVLPGLDPRYDDLIDRAMDSDRESRIQQASEISAILYRIATTPAESDKPRRMLVTSDAPAPPPRDHTRPQKPAASAPAKAAGSDKSTAGLIGGIVAACLVVALLGFFLIKPRLFPPPAPSPPPVAGTDSAPPASPLAAPAPAPVEPASPLPAKAEAAPQVPKAVPPSPPTAVAVAPTLPETIDTAPWTDAIDLLPYIDLGLDTLEPGWKRDGIALFTEKQAHAMLKLPVVAPEEYDVRLNLTRTTPGQSIALILTRQEREFIWVGGAYLNGMFAFGGFRGDRLFANSRGEAKKQAQPCFEEGRTYQVQVSVRNTGAAAYVDGQWVTRLPADLGEMRLPDDSPMAGLGQLGLSTYQAAFRVDVLQLREITGKAKFLRPPAAPAPKPPDPAMTQTPKPAKPPSPATPPPAPTDPVTLRLAELEKAFLAAYDQQVTPKHDTDVAALNTNYLARLDRDIAAASTAGKLDDALALRDERTQVQTYSALPAEDAPTLAAALKPLRATYRGTLTTLLKQRDLAAAPLYATYDRALAAYQDELTKTQQLDAAARVKAVREHIATQRESAAKPVAIAGAPATPVLPPVGQKSGANLPPVPVAPPLPASQVLPPPPKASQEDIRALADWLFRFNGNTISIAEGPVSRVVKESAALPRGNLKVVGIYFYDLPIAPETPRHLATLGGLADLESLNVNRHVGVFPIESLRGLSKLKSLIIGQSKFDDSGFVHLSGLTALAEVRFSQINGFTGTGLGYLGDGIENLSLWGNSHLTAEGLAYLSRFRKLHVLELYQCRNLTDDMLRPLSALTELETMEVYSTPLDGSFLASLPDNSKLTHLDLYDLPNTKPEFLVHLARLNNLKIIGLPPVDPPREVLTALARLGNLQNLAFSHPFTGETLAGVAGFRSLTTLDLKDSPITDAGWAGIVQTMPELKSITLFRPAGSTAPQNAAAMGEQIGRLKNLGYLNFSGPTFTDDWLLAASHAKNLGALDVTSPLVTDAGLVHLQDLPLTGLRINGTSITDASIPTLKKFPKLIGGYIYFPEKMSPAGIAEVKAHCDNREK